MGREGREGTRHVQGGKEWAERLGKEKTWAGGVEVRHGQGEGMDRYNSRIRKLENEL